MPWLPRVAKSIQSKPPPHLHPKMLAKSKATLQIPPLTLTYRSLYTKYTAIYGSNTAVFMQVGVFYELFDILNPETQQPYTNIKRATQILNIVLKEKAGGILEAGFPDFALHKFAQTLTREGWTVVICEQVRDGIFTSRSSLLATRVSR